MHVALRWIPWRALWSLGLGAAACALPRVTERVPDAGVPGAAGAGDSSRVGAQRAGEAGAGGEPREVAGEAGTEAPPPPKVVVDAGTAANGGSASLPMAGKPEMAVAGSGGTAAPGAGSGGAPAASVPRAPSRDHSYADWPMPDALPGSRVMPSYSAAPLTVTDNVTHLVWQRRVPATYESCTGKYAATGDVEQDSCTWEEARQYCASAALAAALGGGSWRLPTKIELESIVDETLFDPAIDTGAFQATQSADYWTATRDVDLPNRAWYVSFLTGYSAAEELPTAKYVRCVSSPAAASGDAPAARYQILPDGVLDPQTGLTWQRDLPDRTYTWEAAKATCQSPWRLPAMKELLTLADTTREEPAIDVAAFPNTQSGLYWTASPLVVDSGKAWTVGFTFGNAYPEEKISEPHRARCVR